MLGFTPEYRPMLAVDMEDSTRHGDLPLLAAGHVLFEAVEATCAENGIDWAGCHREDLGDGMRLVFPAGTPKHGLIVPLIHALSDRLGRHNGTVDAGNRLRLRAALHGGDVQVSEGQVAGHAFAVLTRLLDAPAHLPLPPALQHIRELVGDRGQLRASAGPLPMLLTSRPHEYRKALAATDVLTWAAGIWIEDLTPAELAEYLRRSSRATRWDSVLADLRTHPDSPACKNLARVLSTPLMVVLARSIYNDTGQDPAALLDTTRFPTSDDLENHLLGSFVPTVYQPHSPGVPRPDWTLDRIQRWLGYLARHLDRLDTPDLAWWQLANSLRRSSRVLGVILASAIVTAFSDWLVIGPQYVIDFGFASGLPAGLLDGLLLGPVVGLSFGLVYGFLIVCGGVVFEPSRVQLRLFGRHGGTSVVRTFGERFATGSSAASR